jgi:lycopene cyclase domain-containing protein
MKEYTLLALVSAAATLALDRLLGTRVLKRKTFWIFLAVMYGFKLLANGYLTWRPIVIYAEGHYLNIRLGTIPVEDFVHGFSLIALSVIFWEYLKARGAKRP